MLSYSYLLVAAILVGTFFPPSEMTCIYKGVEYQDGESVPIDNCNTCYCYGNDIACTMMACPDQHSRQCLKNGVCNGHGSTTGDIEWYNDGDRVPSDDCSICVCTDRNIECTSMPC